MFKRFFSALASLTGNIEALVALAEGGRAPAANGSNLGFKPTAFSALVAIGTTFAFV
jgi:hypothetical protein